MVDKLAEDGLELARHLREEPRHGVNRAVASFTGYRSKDPPFAMATMMLRAKTPGMFGRIGHPPCSYRYSERNPGRIRISNVAESPSREGSMIFLRQSWPGRVMTRRRRLRWPRNPLPMLGGVCSALTTMPVGAEVSSVGWLARRREWLLGAASLITPRDTTPMKSVPEHLFGS